MSAKRLVLFLLALLFLPGIAAAGNLVTFPGDQVTSLPHGWVPEWIAVKNSGQATAAKSYRYFDPRTHRELIVYNQKTKRYTAKSRRLPDNTIIVIPEKLVRTAAYQANRETLSDICKKYTTANCVAQLSKSNRIPASAVLTGEVRIPNSFQPRVRIVMSNALGYAGPAAAVLPGPWDFWSLFLPLLPLLTSVLAVKILSVVPIAILCVVIVWQRRKVSALTQNFRLRLGSSWDSDFLSNLNPLSIRGYRKKRWICRYIHRVLVTSGQDRRVEEVKPSWCKPAITLRFRFDFEEPFVRQLLDGLKNLAYSLHPTQVGDGGDCLVKVRFCSLTAWQPPKHCIDTNRLQVFVEQFVEEFSRGLENATNDYRPIVSKVKTSDHCIKIYIAPNKEVGCSYPDPKGDIGDAIGKAQRACMRTGIPEFVLDAGAVKPSKGFLVFVFLRKVEGYV